MSKHFPIQGILLKELPLLPFSQDCTIRKSHFLGIQQDCESASLRVLCNTWFHIGRELYFHSVSFDDYILSVFSWDSRTSNGRQAS